MKKMFSKRSSLAKLVLFGSALGVVAGCSDYLNDFEDKYDNGNAFILSSAESDNNGASSAIDAGDAKSSNSNGSAPASATSSANKEESSDSNPESAGSSESIPGSSSSSSDAESSSSSSNTSFKSKTVAACDGTVIYDENDESSLKIGDLIDGDNPQGGSYLQKHDFSVGNDDNTKTLRLFLDDAADHRVKYDLSGWGGLCIEYTSTTHMGIHFYSAPNDHAINQGTDAVAAFESSNTKKVAKTFEWKDLEVESVKDSTNIIDFYRYASDNGNIKIHKITTFNSFVNGLLIQVTTESSNEDSNNPVTTEESTSCKGATIYDRDNPSTSIGYGFVTTKTQEVSTNPFELSTDKFYPFDSTLGATPYDLTGWEGLCIEYIANEDFNVSIRYAQVTDTSNSVFSSIEVPSSATRTKKVMKWEDFSKAGVNRAKATSLLQFSRIDDKVVPEVTIYKITTAKEISASNSAQLEAAQAITIGNVEWELTDLANSSGGKKASYCGVSTSLQDVIVFSFSEAGAACKTKGNGWRLPTNKEWDDLISAFDNDTGIANNTYQLVIDDDPNTIKSSVYCDFPLNGNAREKQTAFWTANKELISFRLSQNDDVISNKIDSTTTSTAGSLKNARADVRCVRTIQ